MTNPGFAGIINLAFAGVAHLVERDLAKVEVASSSLVARSRRHHLRRWCFFFLPFGAHRHAGRLSPAVAVDRRGTSSKSPRFFRHRRRFGDFLDLREARSNHEVRQGSCEWPRHSRDAGKRVRASSPALRGIADKRRRGLCAPPPFLCACHITAARALARAA